MLLEEMIHAFWRDSTVLAKAIPPERFFTGPVKLDAMPRVVLVHEQTKILVQTNRRNSWKRIKIRFEIHHETFETGAAVARLIEETFDRLRLNAADGSWSFLFQWIESETQPLEDRAWKFVRRFQLTGQ